MEPLDYAIDPELVALVDLLPRFNPDDLSEARATMQQLTARLPPPDTTGVSISERAVPGPEGAPEVIVRIYLPASRSGPVGVLDLHAGGFVLGDLDLNHGANVTMARDTGAVVVSVNYRLAPEHPYPAALEDTYAALSWFAEHADELDVDPARIAVHGISSGGGICAALALLVRDRGGPAIAFQYLGVPEIDDRLQTASMQAFTDTPIFNRPAAVFSWDAYLGDGVAGGADVPVYAAPARATDLSGLPPAYVSAMEFDPLRDEGLSYALALQAAGNQVELHLFPGTFHTSAMFLAHTAISRREQTEKIAVLRRGLAV
ncbi:alpha/beta hydrolase [Pseudonocardia yunnanensis]|uniref:Alpha/beta hydrolase n=1 Tax=Pseudonocardia yunnanensis TaxID=58107 RepID=A0ABW4F3X0_9PSEU